MNKRSPHNPGMSQEAWINLHKFVYKISVKYADKIRNKCEQTVDSKKE